VTANVYTYNMVVYLEKQHVNAAENDTPINGKVLKPVQKVEGVGHKLFMDNCFSTAQLFSDLH
jgi:hypothetical protein